MTDYAFHPIADLFPLIEGEQFDALCADVKKNGLRQNIMLFEGKIQICPQKVVQLNVSLRHDCLPSRKRPAELVWVAQTGAAA